jgi:DMSO/TMAO reductase YedYZ molybdopterin-dependent catalytic subunit
MTPRATDWTLAALVSIGFATGGLTLYAGAPADAWVLTVHAVGGLALFAVVAWKLGRVIPRLRRRELRDRHSPLGIAALILVTSALGSGVLWSSGATLSPFGFTLLAWHEALGAVLMLAVVAHASARARVHTPRNPSARRDFLRAGLAAAGAFAAWRLQKPASGLVGLRSAKRRYTGSYEKGSFAGNAFPTTSWVADKPRAVDAERWRLTVTGLVGRELELELADLEGRDELVATLDCTGGFYSTQRWAGVSVARVLERAGTLRGARHVRVVSRTGYRWSFALADAERLMLATHVGGEPLSHDHGAPLRLVAQDRRGFEWVKWIERLEVTDRPEPGAVASTVWSSFTAAGRGAA